MAAPVHAPPTEQRILLQNISSRYESLHHSYEQTRCEVADLRAMLGQVGQQLEACLARLAAGERTAAGLDAQLREEQRLRLLAEKQLAEMQRDFRSSVERAVAEAVARVEAQQEVHAARLEHKHQEQAKLLLQHAQPQGAEGDDWLHAMVCEAAYAAHTPGHAEAAPAACDAPDKAQADGGGDAAAELAETAGPAPSVVLLHARDLGLRLSAVFQRLQSELPGHPLVFAHHEWPTLAQAATCQVLLLCVDEEPELKQDRRLLALLAAAKEHKVPLLVVRVVRPSREPFLLADPTVPDQGWEEFGVTQAMVERALCDVQAAVAHVKPRCDLQASGKTSKPRVLDLFVGYEAECAGLVQSVIDCAGLDPAQYLPRDPARLRAAVEADDGPLVAQELALGAPPGALLLLAAQLGRPHAAQALLDAGVDPNVADAEGLTPLAWAQLRAPSMVSRLLRAGCVLGTEHVVRSWPSVELVASKQPVLAPTREAVHALAEEIDAALKEHRGGGLLRLLSLWLLQPEPAQWARETVALERLAGFVGMRGDEGLDLLAALGRLVCWSGPCFQRALDLGLLPALLKDAAALSGGAYRRELAATLRLLHDLALPITREQVDHGEHASKVEDRELWDACRARAQAQVAKPAHAAALGRVLELHVTDSQVVTSCLKLLTVVQESLHLPELGPQLALVRQIHPGKELKRWLRDLGSSSG